MPNVPPLNPPTVVYLDNNATTACHPEVVAAMAPYWQTVYGNATSTHYAGRSAHRAIETARGIIAETLAVQPYQIFFNSGATEGNNWIFHAFASTGNDKKRIVVSAIEHKSVLNAAKTLEASGYDVIVLPVTPDGVVSVEAARHAITSGTGLVSIQLANNETGVLQPVQELAAMAHTVGAFFHCDAVQGLGKMKLNLAELGVDSATVSGHKIHAPKGVGLLYLQSGSAQFPFPLPLQGGGQEQGIRPGTLNVPGIVGMGKAFELFPNQQEVARLRALQARLENGLAATLPGCRVHGQAVLRLPNTTNISVPAIPSDILMANLPMFCVSNGSACDSGSLDASYVLKAMGIPTEEARRSIRISTSIQTAVFEIDSFVSQVFLKYEELK